MQENPISKPIMAEGGGFTLILFSELIKFFLTPSSIAKIHSWTSPTFRFNFSDTVLRKLRVCDQFKLLLLMLVS